MGEPMADIHRLQVFLLAAETVNFTETARRLHMTQPSVSQHIQALEQQFDVLLFDRSGRYLTLTEAGQHLASLVQELMRQWVRIEETMDSMKGDVAGHLMIGSSTAPARYVLPPLLARFHARYPKIKVSCHASSHEKAFRMLRNGDLHYALDGAMSASDDEIERHRVVIDPIRLIVPPAHPWAARGTIEPEELYEGQFIMREEGSGTREAVSQALARAGIVASDLETVITLGDSEGVALAVQEGLGVGFVSDIVVLRLVAERVAVTNIRSVPIVRDVFICHNLRWPETMAQAAFREFIFEQVQVEDGSDADAAEHL